MTKVELSRMTNERLLRGLIPDRSPGHAFVPMDTRGLERALATL